MDKNYVLIQLVGAIAWLFLLVSYYRKNTNKILIFQIIGTFLYCLHYYFLGAYSGLFICAFEIFFDYGYYKTDKDKYIYIISIPFRILGGLFTYKNIYDILPIIASLIDGASLTQKKKIVVIGAVISYALWVIYDIFVGSISGLITDGILVISNLLILFNVLKKNEIIKLK